MAEGVTIWKMGISQGTSVFQVTRAQHYNIMMAQKTYSKWKRDQWILTRQSAIFLSLWFQIFIVTNFSKTLPVVDIFML